MCEIMYLIGLPCSGKSTYIKNCLSDYVVISNDKIIDEYASQNNITYGEAWNKISFKYVKNQCKKEFNNAILNNKNIVIDNTNMTVKSRRTYRDDKYKNKAVVFICNEKERKKRELKRLNETQKYVPQNAIDNMNKIFQYPSKDEGFYEIIEVK